MACNAISSIAFVKTYFDAASALFAFLAAFLWFRAASAPVLAPESPFYVAENIEQVRADIRKAQRGAKFNKWAAFVTGLAALAAGLSWLFQACSNSG